MNWKIAGIKGPKAAIVKKILSDVEVPSHIRTAIAQGVNELPEQFNGAQVDAHGSLIGQTVTYHVTITPLVFVE
jgi:hypothetical protein